MKFGSEGFPRRSPQEEKGKPDVPDEAMPIAELQDIAAQLAERTSQLPQQEPTIEEGFEVNPADDFGDTVRGLREKN